jgi:hypothetical protein
MKKLNKLSLITLGVSTSAALICGGIWWMRSSGTTEQAIAQTKNFKKATIILGSVALISLGVSQFSRLHVVTDVKELAK